MAGQSGFLETKSIHFQLSMQILYDNMLERYPQMLFFSKADFTCLDDLRLYHRELETNFSHVYLAESRDPDAQKALARGCQTSGASRIQHWIFVGPADVLEIPENCAAIVIENATLPSVVELVQDIFRKYRKWDYFLHLAPESEEPLTEMLKVSVPIFQNPIFIHDTNFYVLAWSHRAPGMLVWDQDPRTGRNIIPLNLINDFKVDVEYLNTLKARTPSLFSAEQRGYPILFMNLWNEGSYEGRICVDELETPIMPGQYPAIAYLSRMILSFMKKGSLFRLSKQNNLPQFFQDYLDGKNMEQAQILNYLYYLNWKRMDRYLCLRLEAKRQDNQMVSSAAALGHIQTQIPEGHALIYKNGFTVIINLSYSHSSIADIIQRLSLLLREGLLEMGVSSEIHDFFLVPQGHLQACAALNLGQNSASMVWCHHFDDYILEYLLKKGSESLPPQLLCSQKLLILKEYDKKNHTDFYNTLKIYLELERNVLQTAKSLFIHRSTLFYRLERIGKIADIDLENARERLILRISFYILEQES